MTDHYEVLGVPKDAPRAALKKAWKKLSSKAHPDKGGSTAAMAALNVAYDTLSDPARRERYDLNGEEGVEHLTTVEGRGRNRMMGAFRDALMSEGDPVEVARAVLAAECTEQAQLGVGAKNRLRQVTQRQARIRRTDGDGPNLLQRIAGELILQIKNDLAGFEDRAAVAQCALKALEGYRYDGDPPAPSYARREVWAAGGAVGPSPADVNRANASFWRDQ